MESSGIPKQSRLLGRLLGRLRGDHRSSMDKNILSFSSTGTSESVGCGSTYDEEEASCVSQSQGQDAANLAANIDMRYSGQYLTPEQLPEFCKQLSHLVDVIRNIQSYGKVVGEYPRELERQLEQEASEVAALAGEARYARDTIARVQLQRRALAVQRSHINTHLKKLRESEVRELETAVRVSDRKLFRSWELIKEAKDPDAYENLLDEVKNKQKTLNCMLQLIENRQAVLAREQRNSEAEDDAVLSLPNRKHQDTRRCFKRKKRAHESRSDHKTPSAPKQVTLYITGGSTVDDTESTRSSSELPSLELPQGPTPNIMFFTIE